MRLAILAVILALLPLRAKAIELTFGQPTPSAAQYHLMDERDILDSGKKHYNLQVATAAIMVSTIAALIVWDVYVARKGSATESTIISRASWKYSTIPFAAGVLIGHWLFNRSQVNYNSWPVALAATGVILTWDVLKPKDTPRWMRHPAVWFVIGIPIGSFFWGQGMP